MPGPQGKSPAIKVAEFSGASPAMDASYFEQTNNRVANNKENMSQTMLSPSCAIKDGPCSPASSFSFSRVPAQLVNLLSPSLPSETRLSSTTSTPTTRVAVVKSHSSPSVATQSHANALPQRASSLSSLHPTTSTSTTTSAAAMLSPSTANRNDVCDACCNETPLKPAAQFLAPSPASARNAPAPTPATAAVAEATPAASSTLRAAPKRGGRGKRSSRHVTPSSLGVATNATSPVTLTPSNNNLAKVYANIGRLRSALGRAPLVPPPSVLSNHDATSSPAAANEVPTTAGVTLPPAPALSPVVRPSRHHVTALLSDPATSSPASSGSSSSNRGTIVDTLDETGAVPPATPAIIMTGPGATSPTSATGGTNSIATGATRQLTPPAPLASPEATARALAEVDAATAAIVARLLAVEAQTPSVPHDPNDRPLLDDSFSSSNSSLGAPSPVVDRQPAEREDGSLDISPNSSVSGGFLGSGASVSISLDDSTPFDPTSVVSSGLSPTEEYQGSSQPTHVVIAPPTVRPYALGVITASAGDAPSPATTATGVAAPARDAAPTATLTREQLEALNNATSNSINRISGSNLGGGNHHPAPFSPGQVLSPGERSMTLDSIAVSDLISPASSVAGTPLQLLTTLPTDPPTPGGIASAMHLHLNGLRRGASAGSLQASRRAAGLGGGSATFLSPPLTPSDTFNSASPPVFGANLGAPSTTSHAASSSSNLTTPRTGILRRAAAPSSSNPPSATATPRAARTSISAQHSNNASAVPSRLTVPRRRDSPSSSPERPVVYQNSLSLDSSAYVGRTPSRTPSTTSSTGATPPTATVTATGGAATNGSNSNANATSVAVRSSGPPQPHLAVSNSSVVRRGQVFHTMNTLRNNAAAASSAASGPQRHLSPLVEDTASSSTSTTTTAATEAPRVSHQTLSPSHINNFRSPTVSATARRAAAGGAANNNNGNAGGVAPGARRQLVFNGAGGRAAGGGAPVDEYEALLRLDERIAPRGLSRQTMASMRTMSFKKLVACCAADGRDACSICLEAFELDNAVLRLQCSHVFHGTCARRHFRTSVKCPNCRFNCETRRPEGEA